MEQNLSFQYVHVSKTWSVCSFLQLLRRCSGESRAILCVATIRSNTMKIINYLHIFTTENICFCVKGHMNGLIYNTVNSWFRTCRYFIQFIFSLLLGLPCAFSAGKVLVPNFIVIGLFGFFCGNRAFAELCCCSLSLSCIYTHIHVLFPSKCLKFWQRTHSFSLEDDPVLACSLGFWKLASFPKDPSRVPWRCST